MPHLTPASSFAPQQVHAIQNIHGVCPHGHTAIIDAQLIPWPVESESLRLRTLTRTRPHRSATVAPITATPAASVAPSSAAAAAAVAVAEPATDKPGVSTATRTALVAQAPSPADLYAQALHYFSLSKPEEAMSIPCPCCRVQPRRGGTPLR